MGKSKIKPIIFNGSMVKAILKGHKTQTRRVMKLGGHSPSDRVYRSVNPRTIEGRRLVGIRLTNGKLMKCPYGVPGDRLWVRETWNCIIDDPDSGHLLWASDVKKEYRTLEHSRESVVYRATDDDPEYPWMPSIFMPRWASRIKLEITDMRVERIQDIASKTNALLQEGIEAGVAIEEAPTQHRYERSSFVHETIHANIYTSRFMDLWDSINAKRGYSWEFNPWVWALEFKVVE